MLVALIHPTHFSHCPNVRFFGEEAVFAWASTAESHYSLFCTKESTGKLACRSWKLHWNILHVEACNKEWHHVPSLAGRMRRLPWPPAGNTKKVRNQLRSTPNTFQTRSNWTVLCLASSLPRFLSGCHCFSKALKAFSFSAVLTMALMAFITFTACKTAGGILGLAPGRVSRAMAFWLSSQDFVRSPKQLESENGERGGRCKLHVSCMQETHTWMRHSKKSSDG